MGTADSNAAHCIVIKSAAEQAITYLLVLTFRPMTENSGCRIDGGEDDGVPDDAVCISRIRVLMQLLEAEAGRLDSHRHSPIAQKVTQNESNRSSGLNPPAQQGWAQGYLLSSSSLRVSFTPGWAELIANSCGGAFAEKPVFSPCRNNLLKGLRQNSGSCTLPSAFLCGIKVL